MADLSVVIPTLDEELHIQRAIKSVIALGPVFVLDAGSADRTRDLARSAGAFVHQRAWKGYSDQKNFALDELPIRSDWVLFIDADEVVSSELRQEIRSAIDRNVHSGYMISRRFIFLGRELKHAWWYPDFQLRLFRKSCGRFEERLVHEHVVVSGKIGTLRHSLLHENLKGLEAFIERHNHYSTLEVERLANAGGDSNSGSLLGNRSQRRRFAKDRVWFRIPFRPSVRYLWLTYIKRGFLDGPEGRMFCRLIASYDLFINAKLLEARLHQDKVIE